MRREIEKIVRFAWRLGRNALCATRRGKQFIFPSELLGRRFGTGDAGYAINVFLHHHSQLSTAKLSSAKKILEVGPGRNLGTPLLMWERIVADAMHFVDLRD